MKFSYELRSAETGGVLQGADRLEALMRHVEEKRNVTIVRTRDGQVIWPVEKLVKP